MYNCSHNGLMGPIAAVRYDNNPYTLIQTEAQAFKLYPFCN